MCLSVTVVMEGWMEILSGWWDGLDWRWLGIFFSRFSLAKEIVRLWGLVHLALSWRQCKQQMKGHVLVILTLLLTACAQLEKPSPLDNCQALEKWTLKPLEDNHLKFKISLPKWQTVLDFVNGDTISITAIDSIRLTESKAIRSISIIQYDTYIDIDSNFQVIKEAIITYSDIGNIDINNYQGRYMIRDEYFDADTVSTFLALFQTKKLAINFIARVSKDKDNQTSFCDFLQVLKTINLEASKIALAPINKASCGRHSLPRSLSGAQHEVPKAFGIAGNLR